ncbi:MAG: PD-(D/E)XK nuclease family protein [Elusimicrobiota bacterium]
MNPEVIGHKESLAERAGEILLGARSLADNIVVFPGKRPGHFLRRYLAEKRGSAQRAPVIVSMDGFVDLAAERLGVKGTAASSLDLAGLLYERLNRETRGLVAGGTEEMTLDAFLPWALKLTGDFEELRVGRKTARDLAAYDQLLPGDLRSEAFIRRLESFSRLYEDFYKEVEKAGLLTRSMKYSAVAEGVAGLDLGEYENIIFAGLFALTASEKAILKHLASRGARVLLEPGPGLEEQFAFLGKAEQPPAEERPAPFFYKAADLHGEVFGLARALKDPSPGDVVVLPEPRALFPVMEHVLPAAGEYNVSMGYPLVATPVYALIDALGDLLDKRSGDAYFAPNYLKFVFHPYVKNLYLGGSAEPGRVIFQTAEEVLSESMDKYIRLEEIENEERILAGAAARLKDYGHGVTKDEVRAHLAGLHGALIRPFERVRDVAGFADRLLALVSHISENSTAPLHPYWAPFVEKAMEHILELKTCRLAGAGFDAPAGYFKFFKTALAGAAYPFPGTPLRGLQVLGLLETRGLRFDRVFFLDANADVLPAARKEDTLLPHFVREGLGLSTYKTRERLARYHFSALVSGAREAHIFYKDSAEQERSPFVERLAWERERAGAVPSGEEVHLRVDFSQAEPRPAAKTPELLAALKKREFSPSAIDSYLACGLRFYYRYALGLDEKAEIADEVEQRDIGVVVHSVLEDFFKARAGRPLEIGEEDYSAVLESAGRVFDKLMRGHGAGVEYLIKRQVERRLRDILDYHRANLAGVKILGCETKLRAELDTRFGPVALRGFADRVDERDGVTHILDYKTGASAHVPNWQKFDLGMREDWPRTLRSVQLPFYILAWMDANGVKDPARMDASLMLLGSETIAEETLYRERNKKSPDKAVVFGIYKEAIKTLIEEILDPDLPFSPPADEEPCRGCAFRGLCGRQWTS